MRVGIGIDVHRFASGRPLVLGGISIPYQFGLAGHSDADVVVHAIIDALLGAAGAGDIGSHFPDSDPRYKDCSSLELLRSAMGLLRADRYEVGNIDVTIMLEAPKLDIWRDKMRESLAAAMGVDVGRVSVKATTSEGLGFTGRSEGVAAHAVVLVEKF